jgi:hypothetical protein
MTAVTRAPTPLSCRTPDIARAAADGIVRKPIRGAIAALGRAASAPALETIR